jgi:hypothetical protein
MNAFQNFLDTELFFYSFLFFFFVILFSGLSSNLCMQQNTLLDIYDLSFYFHSLTSTDAIPMCNVKKLSLSSPESNIRSARLGFWTCFHFVELSKFYKWTYNFVGLNLL